MADPCRQGRDSPIGGYELAASTEVGWPWRRTGRARGADRSEARGWWWGGVRPLRCSGEKPSPPHLSILIHSAFCLRGGVGGVVGGGRPSPRRAPHIRTHHLEIILGGLRFAPPTPPFALFLNEYSCLLGWSSPEFPSTQLHPTPPPWHCRAFRGEQRRPLVPLHGRGGGSRRSPALPRPEAGARTSKRRRW